MTDTPVPILIVEDDPDIASVLSRGLAQHGFAAVCEARADRALRRLTDAPPAAAIVDVMIEAGSGLTLVSAARARGFRNPLLMLSALDQVEDRARGLEAGADDYIVKPFSMDELAARLMAQTRRAGARSTAALPFDATARTLRGPEGTVQLTEREARLLAYLFDNMPRTLSRGEIFDALWSGEGTSSENVVDVYVSYLRRKLGPPEAFGLEIQTVRNRGFRLVRAGAIPRD